ncbi:MAG: ABC transporter substrate-binding protein [Syntrophobacteraceae bacterium]
MFIARSQIGLMSKRFISKTLILVVCLCLWGLPAIAAEDPQAVVKNGTEQVLKILQQYPQDTKARRDQIRAAVEGYIDFEAIARLAVGRRWSTVPPEKQQEFTQELSKLLFNTYMGDIEKYAKQNITYSHREIYPGYVVVEAHVGDQNLDYYLHLKDGNWKVYDVGIAGMSLVMNYREQFDPILANNSFDQLSMILKQKIDKLCGLDRC